MKDEYKAVGSWGTLGLEIVLSIVLGFLAGRWLDGRFGTEPWISVVGFLFGLGAAAKAVHRTWTEMQAVTLREEREHGNPSPRYERLRDREPRDEGTATPAPTSVTPPEDHDGAP